MNSDDALHVVLLLTWLTDPAAGHAQDALRAAQALADAARTSTGTGPTGVDLATGWPVAVLHQAPAPDNGPDERHRTAPGRVEVAGPLYQRIAADLAAQITSGVYVPGDQMPSETDLMARYRVSRLTARAATAVLRHAGLVTTRHGRGTHVRTPPAPANGDNGHRTIAGDVR